LPDIGDSPPPKTTKSLLHKNEVGYYYYKHVLEKVQSSDDTGTVRDWNAEFQVNVGLVYYL
jgi:hypothetical protein